MKPVWFAATRSDQLPKNVVRAGPGVLVGRALHEDELLPATVWPDNLCAYVSKNGRVYEKSKYEVLMDNGYSWQSCEWGYFPALAKDFNTNKKRQQMFIGSVKYKDTICVGRVDPSQGLLYFPHNGEEVSVGYYNIIVLDTAENWISARSHYTPSDAVIAGVHYNNAIIYVGRVLHNGKWELANVIPNIAGAYICSTDDDMLYVVDYQLLCGSNYRWQKVYDHFIPPNTVSVGSTSTGDPRYVGRADIWFKQELGYVSLDRKCVMFRRGEKVRDYEILVKC